MTTRLLLLLCLTGHVFARETPDVDCLVVNLQHVQCSWDKEGTPEVNYTFYGGFSSNLSECPTYLSENNTNTGCKQPYKEAERFQTFYSILQRGQQNRSKKYQLRTKVKLNPPTNVTAKNESDSNLWVRWIPSTFPKIDCVQNEVRYRINNRKWAAFQVHSGVNVYCINLPSRSSLYEVQVRSRISYVCGESDFWSDWSEPVLWGSNNSTEPNQMLMPVWTPVLYVVGAFILILLVMMLLHHERIRIIFIPVVPKPSPKLHNIEDWFQFPKGLKESFNYNERPCIVREYCHVSQVSVSEPESEWDQSNSCSSSTTTVLSEEGMGSV
uniref:Fibronectin type-III domain-containing protein n=1 Tax=Gasterosteus aculeatus aculeatus TaxID=481459 RepID=A0AAQ4QME4_GASAC|nr:cytokine receptor common subunit gamma-like [Gasterosteus aculeatus aculeatus]